MALVAVTVAMAVGCSRDSQPVAESGEPPLPETTTTVAETTTTTAVAEEGDGGELEPVRIPVAGDWAEQWDGPADLRPDDPDTGSLLTNEFDRFVLENAPADTTPEEAVAAYLALEPGQAGVQMFAAPVDVSGAKRVVVVVEQQDDSIRAVRYEFVVEMVDRAARLASEDPAEAPEEDPNEVELVPDIVSARLTQQCQPGRGHQDFTPEPCV